MVLQPPEAPTRRVFGVEVLSETLRGATGRINALVDASYAPTIHVVLNAAKVSGMARDPEVYRLIRHFDMIHADGASVVWASRLLGEPLPERVAGIDLMEGLVACAAVRGYRPFLLGARPHIVERCEQVLTERHPGLRIAGTHHGYWDPDDPAAEAEVVRTVRDSGADLLFVAIPSPRKERFLVEHKDALGVPFAMGVGGAFDVIAGEISRAPLAWQRAGMEWAYRLIQEPRKMWKRYLVTNTHFIVLVLRELVVTRLLRRRSTFE